MGRGQAPRLLLAALFCAGLAACQKEDDGRAQSAADFPRPYRPVSELSSNQFSTEQARDSKGEADTVMDLAEIEPGMTVADIGAGEGYYTIRLGNRVGASGRVLAQDIDEGALRRLGLRVEREQLGNVSIALGAEDDPRLPENSFDRVFLIHMYHEVAEPYAFLWRLRPALKESGQVIVVDMDRAPDRHGIWPKLLFCEFDRTGFQLVEFVRRPEIAGYYAKFEAVGERPSPSEIEPCAQAGEYDSDPSADEAGKGETR